MSGVLTAVLPAVKILAGFVWGTFCITDVQRGAVRNLPGFTLDLVCSSAIIRNVSRICRMCHEVQWQISGCLGDWFWFRKTLILRPSSLSHILVPGNSLRRRLYYFCVSPFFTEGRLLRLLFCELFQGVASSLLRRIRTLKLGCCFFVHFALFIHRTGPFRISSGDCFTCRSGTADVVPNRFV